jgi:hypothetical protein
LIACGAWNDLPLRQRAGRGVLGASCLFPLSQPSPARGGVLLSNQ